MALLVQKFGGTSVGSVSRIKEVAKRIAARKDNGDELVVVVSAMGKATDELSNLAQQISNAPPQRELDMLLATGEQVSIALLSIAIQELGIAAISMTGSQAGIITESSHGRARILKIRTERIKNLLNEGKVIVIAGFQGTSLNSHGISEITTLGRGGSDTSAVALATALQASACEIYTDVEGVLTTDPRQVKKAKLMNELSCDEMLELASLGAEVLHPRAVELAKNYGVPLIVRSSWNESPGTKLTSENARPLGREGLELGKPVDGLELIEDQAVIGLSHIPDKPGIAADLFETLSNGGVNVDLIIQATHEGSSNDIAFTIAKKDLQRACELSKTVIKDIGGELKTQNDMSKLSICGAGIMGRPGIAAKFFETLSREGINLRLIATSEVKVSCVIDSSTGNKGLRATSEAFELNENQIKVNPVDLGNGEPEVRALALDPDQSQVSVVRVPDKPGAAAALCSCLAEANISIDAIMQSERQHQDNSRDISFTLKKEERKSAGIALSALLAIWKGSKLKDGTAIARISAVGAGMPSTPGTAARIFRALANSNINIGMIATSEIRTSCIVAKENGTKALKVIHEYFNLGE